MGALRSRSTLRRAVPLPSRWTRTRARIVHMSVRGDDPAWMLTAPIPATRRALQKAGMALSQIDLVEINEAFASVVMAWAKELGADMSRVNVNGGALALGHPPGATPAAWTTSRRPARAAKRRSGQKWMSRSGSVVGRGSADSSAG